MANVIKGLLQKLTIIVHAAVLISALFMWAPTAAAAPNPSYVAPAGGVFNNPYGSSSEQWAVMNRVKDAINNAPAGSVVRIAAFSITLPQMTDAMINAHNRGVNVRVVTDDHLYDKEDPDYAAKTAQTERLKVALGTSITKTSYIKICHLGCMSNNEYASMHAKLYMFSTTGKSKQVTMIGSANMSGTHLTAWNNMFTTVGDVTVYDTMRLYFDRMATEPDDQNAYQNVLSESGRRVYTFPRAGVDTLSEDIYWGILDNVKCTGVSSGYGTTPSNSSTSKTVIRLAMFKWTENRLGVATKLRDLSNAGCDVQVAVSKTQGDYSRDALIAILSNGKIKVRDLDKNSNGTGGFKNYLHHKYITINGYYDGDSSSKVVFTGSSNLSSASMRYSNETLIRIYTTATHDSYLSNFNKMWAQGRTVTLAEAQGMGL